MTALSVRVLGQLTVDGVDLARLDRKARTLLQLLALARGRPVTTDALAEALWGARPPARPGDQLAVLASRIRRDLGRERVEHTGTGYRLCYDWLDLAELEVVVTEAERRHESGQVAGAVAAARVALALLRGPVPEVRPEAEWAATERAAAVRLVRRARRIAAATLLAAGQWQDALEIATAARAEDPYDEDAVRTAMRAEASSGRPALALAIYADHRSLLAEQLGVDPSPETTELNTAILRGELAVTTRQPLRPAIVGRTSQVAHLDSLVLRVAAEGRPRAAVVTGEAGIGKTTLLSSWAAARRELGDRVLFGTCGRLDRAMPLDVVLTAIGADLRGRPEALELLGEDHDLLATLVGFAPPDRRRASRRADPSLGPSLLYAAVSGVLTRIAGDGHLILVVDDAHLAGPPLADWLAFALRRPVPLLVVLGTRPHVGPALPATDEVAVGPLDLAQVAEVVGAERAADLFRRSAGHPLFLAELAAVPSGELPASLVAAVVARCDQLGPAGDLVRTAAVLGDELDVELLAGVLGRGALDVLGDAELAVSQGLLVDDGGRLRFRHELVREALVSGTTPGRSTLLHREAGRALSRRPDADPALVAQHARRGGDTALAATALRTAAARAAERFAHATAEDLLDQSLELSEDHRTLLARARVRIRRRRYREAEADALAAAGTGAERWETAAWAAYFDRRFDDAIRYAEDGALTADDETTRARCLVASGRIMHARGELAAAGHRLEEALLTVTGEERLEAAAWLGVVHAHRSNVGDALRLLRPATRPGLSVDHTSASLHAVLFTGHALAVAGRPAEALQCFARYTTDVERRDVPRFAGRGVNFGGWVLRNVGARGAALDAHQEAVALSGEGRAGEGTGELLVAALEDLADDRIRAADPDAAHLLLERARAALTGDLVFGWRLAMKLQMLEAQVQLLRDAPAVALEVAQGLRDRAAAAGIPRYESCARLVVHRARAALGEPVDPDESWRDLAAVERAVGVEAWWWAGQTGAELGEERWLVRSEQLAADLARRCGPHAESLRAEAERRLVGWRGLSVR